MKKVTLLALLFTLTGCADVFDYMANRADDLSDMVHGDVGFGPGLHADIRATQFMQIGAGYSQMWRAGWTGREGRLLHEIDAGIPLAGMGIENASPLTQGLLFWIPYRYRDACPTAEHNQDTIHCEKEENFLFFLSNREVHLDQAKAWTIDAGVSAGIVGARIGTNLAEIFDFVAGIFTLDPLKDDTFHDPHAVGDGD